MIKEKPALEKLRQTCCLTNDKTEFECCYREYKRKGGIRKLIFVPEKNLKKTYAKVFRIERDGKKKYTYYRNQLPDELIQDCIELKNLGMRADDIILSLKKNYGYIKDNSIRYALYSKKFHTR